MKVTVAVTEAVSITDYTDYTDYTPVTDSADVAVMVKVITDYTDSADVSVQAQGRDAVASTVPASVNDSETVFCSGER